MSLSDNLGNVAQWAAFSISLLAFFRPNIDKWYLRRFRPVSIDIYKIGLLNVGFNEYGPTIHLSGSLHCINGDQYIKNFSLKIIRMKDKSEHIFDWSAFVQNSFDLKDAKLELPYGFTMKDAESRPHNVVFIDNKTLSELKGLAYQIRANFHRYIEENFEGVPNADELEDLFEQFRSNNGYYEIAKQIELLPYWYEGEYELVLYIEASGRADRYEKKYKFELGKEYSNNLRLNYMDLCRVSCGLSAEWGYNVAGCEYAEV